MTYQFRLREEPFDFSYGFDDYENGLLESDLEFADLEELFDPEFADMEWEAEVDRSSREYLRWVQSSLNKILGLRLAVDGISGTATRSAVRSFQQQKGLTPDGIIGPITEAALIAAGASAPPAAGTISTPSTGTIPNVNALLPSYVPSRTTSTTLPLSWGAKVSPAFRARVRQIGGELGINPNFLMAAMAFETNETFDPSIRNPYSGATGLIQFTATTAGKLGTSTDSLARMSAEQQLDYVAAYFRPYKGQLKTIEDVYMAVLYGPEAVGVPNDTVLFSTPSREYEWNKALDSNRDGRITKAEAAAPVIARLNKGMQAALQGELHALENPWRRELSLSGRLQEQKWERPFSEGEEVDLAAELLSVSNEEELDQFLGKLFKGAWKGLKKVGSVVGKFAKPLGRVLKGVAKAALPFVGGALGSVIPGVGTVIGSALGGALSKALEMEFGELNQEEQEFEMARRFVRIAGTAAQQAALASPSTDPQAAVTSALITAAHRHVGNLPDMATAGSMVTGGSSGSARSGRWVRR